LDLARTLIREGWGSDQETYRQFFTSRNEASSTAARLLIWTATLTWLSLALFYGSIVAFPRSGSSVVDWTNRILITTYVLWLLVARRAHPRLLQNYIKLRPGAQCELRIAPGQKADMTTSPREVRFLHL